jgi:hypothetical protein
MKEKGKPNKIHFATLGWKGVMTDIAATKIA